MVIGGYLLLTVGGLAAIAGSTIVAATDHNVLGASIDPKNGTYGVVLAKRF